MVGNGGLEPMYFHMEPKIISVGLNVIMRLESLILHGISKE